MDKCIKSHSVYNINYILDKIKDSDHTEYMNKEGMFYSTRKSIEVTYPEQLKLGVPVLIRVPRPKDDRIDHGNDSRN